jgi:hypothetical protein
MLILAMYEGGGQAAEKETYPCCHHQGSSCIVRVRGVAMENLVVKKVMGKERRSEE